ncbi:hypothetical protein CKA32_002789 [Geitlerinema sp. FC II]|nr:hypothetical protein [Geitlerinema sp. CS-897]PPT06711.1 hypothetical protein CKA32_002789 [Geitlerinema sp. FC II]
MSSSFLPSRPALSDFFFEVWQSGTLTQTHRYQLKEFLLYEDLNEADYALLDRLLHAIKRGWVSWTGDRNGS